VRRKQTLLSISKRRNKIRAIEDSRREVKALNHPTEEGKKKSRSGGSARGNEWSYPGKQSASNLICSKGGGRE